VRNLQALSLVLVSHEARLYWLSATLSSTILLPRTMGRTNRTLPISNFTSAESII
jgi:hypothetical protein